MQTTGVFTMIESEEQAEIEKDPETEATDNPPKVRVVLGAEEAGPKVQYVDKKVVAFKQ